MQNPQKVADDYTLTMHDVQQIIETYQSKKDILMYLEAIKTSVTFTIKITKQVMKGSK